MIDPLTEREIIILGLIARGQSNQEIATELSLALDTVKWYNKRIYSKLGVRNRTEAAALAETHLLGIEEARAASSSATNRSRNNLPVQVTSFVGRQREIDQVTQLLSSARLITLTGPAGSGKTRLALQAALMMMPQFSDGVLFVPLALVAKANDVLWAIAQATSIQFHPQLNLFDQLQNYFGDRQVLLVLDNFEHVLDGAIVPAELLKRSGGIRILATSRERLGLYGEVTYQVGGLSTKHTNAVEDVYAESVELFIQRAMATDPQFVVHPEDLVQVARICRLVEGLPLAIELAATWVDMLSLEAIAGEIERGLDILKAEIRDVPHWHKSMRAAITRSWGLLNAEQQAAFRRLAVFGGDFTRDAAESVTGVRLSTLQALVSKSLIRFAPDSERYAIHELLRQYAQEQLESSGDSPEIHEAYATYYADFMAARWPQLKDHRQQTALLEIEAEIENARRAWRYWLSLRNVSRLRQFLHSFWVIYDIHGWYPAGIELFEQAIHALHDLADDEAQSVLGWLLAVQGIYNVACGIYQVVDGGLRKGFALAQNGLQWLERQHSSDEMMIIPLISLFITASHVNEFAIAFAAAQECLEIATRLGDQWAVARAKQCLTIQAVKLDDFDTAMHLAQEALDTFAEAGDHWSESVLCIEVLSLLAVTMRAYDDAEVWIRRGLVAAELIDFKYATQMAYWQLGYVAALQQHYAEAGRNWRKALEVGEDVIGSPVVIGFGGTGMEWDSADSSANNIPRGRGTPGI